MSEQMPSADQDKWVDITEALRNGIELMIPKLSKMSPSEINYLTDAATNVFALSIRARAYDARVQKESLPYGDGGCI